MIRVVSPHFVAGVVPGDRAAPVIGYMVRWSPERIAAYCRARGWTCETMP